MVDVAPLAFLGALNPLLLWGGLLVAGPIIIHLLNRRRYRVVQWAAMDLLLEAERQNRRRIRLEHLILLLLRCLAVLLIALLVARLVFDPTGLGMGAVRGARVERIVVLDDSPSMTARDGNRAVFERARAALGDFLRQLALERPGDTLTVVLTSQPEQPWLRGQVLTADRIEALSRMLGALQPAAVPARFDQTLLAVEDLLAEETDAGNRALYLLSDFRRQDWEPPPGTPEGGGVVGQLQRLAEPLQECVLVDVGAEIDGNLAIAAIRPREKSLVRNVAVSFDVAVHNFGPRDVDRVAVTFAAGDAAPQRQEIPSIAPGETATVDFPVTFHTLGPVQLQAELESDPLPFDNLRYHANGVGAGVKYLIVDGEERSEPSLSESFYLRLAIAPPGDLPSGFEVEVVSDGEFEARTLDDAQGVVLANVYRLSPERARTLAAWVEDGGGLAIFPGDQLDPISWNEELAEYAPSLQIARFGELGGDPTERSWRNLRVTAGEHPALRTFAGDNDPFLQRVKLFRFWRLEPRGEGVQTLLRFSPGDGETEGPPALLEAAVGDGRVLLFATAADAEWGTWPSDLSYVVLMQELARYLARPRLRERDRVVGSELTLSLDPSRYASEAGLAAPGRETPEALRAVPVEDGRLRLEVPAWERAGVYRLELQTLDGQNEPRLYAANVDTAEGDPRAMPEDELKGLLGEAPVRFAREAILSADVDSARAELWRVLLIALLATLAVEQFLAWHFGRRR